MKLKNNGDGFLDPSLNIGLVGGSVEDTQAEIERCWGGYKNPRDSQLVGLGTSAHVALNEPGTPF